MRLRPLLLTLAFAPAAQAADPPDLEPVKRWLSRQAEVQSVSADFIQERRLRALKKPISHHGKFWFKAPGSFRWELGTPAETIAVQRPDEGLWVLRPKKRHARLYTAEELAEEGGGQMAGFMQSGFPRTYEDFIKNFTVTGVSEKEGTIIITTKLNDRRASVAVRKIEFTVDATSMHLKRFYLRFRDSSSITTIFPRPPNEGARVEDSVFEVDLEGYEVKE
jgi:outer membrane lipoprotein-sorting protein